MLSRRMWFVGLISVVGAAGACSPGDSSAPDPGPGPSGDAGSTTPDSGVPPASDGESTRDAGRTASDPDPQHEDTSHGDVASLVADIVEADAYVAELECRCYWEEDGYVDEQECVADGRYTDQEVQCFVDAVSGDGSAAAALECERDVLEQAASCVESAACDESALDSCYTAEEAQHETCPALDGATESAIEACFD